MLDQEQRLIEIHSLLLACRRSRRPGRCAPASWRLGAGADRHPVHRRHHRRRRRRSPPPTGPGCSRALGSRWGSPRRMTSGPSSASRTSRPSAINGVSTNYIAARGGHRVDARPSRRWRCAVTTSTRCRGPPSPIRTPGTRSTPARAAPTWGSVAGSTSSRCPSRLTLERGSCRSSGNFTVTSDGYVLHSSYTGVALQAGLRVLMDGHWQVVGEVDAYPGRLVHASLSSATCSTSGVRRDRYGYLPTWAASGEARARTTPPAPAPGPETAFASADGTMPAANPSRVPRGGPWR